MRYTWLVVLLLIAGCQKQSKPDAPIPMNTTESTIGTPEWKVRAAIQPGDTTHILCVNYRDEIGGQHQQTCMAVFENDKTKEYLLVAPWLTTSMKIQKGNLLTDLPVLVSKDSVALSMK